MAVRSHLTVPTKAELISVVIAGDQTIFLAGELAPGDRPARYYWYDPNSTATDDGENVMKPTSIFGPGRYLKKEVVQLPADWNQSSPIALDYIANKPTLSPVATTGDYNDLSNIPSIPASQVKSDWTASSGVSEILNKPTLSTVASTGDYADLSNKPSIPAAQVKSDWSSVAGASEILNKPALSTVATSGSYVDLSNKPSIPAAQVNADWNSVSGLSQVLNKPTIPTNTNQLTNGAGFLTGITSGQVTTALGLTPVSQAGARAAITLTTTGTSGAAAYNSTSGVLNVPAYANSGGTVTSVGLSSTDFAVSGSPVTNAGSITANLNTSGVTAGSYGQVTVTNKGIVTAGKKLELYSGTTNGSGNYTVSFPVAYSTAPNIQASITNQSATNQFIKVTSVSTTGFTVNVYQRSSVTLLTIEVLLAAISNVTGAAVDVLVTEK